MPLNELQRETLFRTVTAFVDTILESSLSHDLKIQSLQDVIDTHLPTIPKVLQTLRQHPNLIESLASCIKVPTPIRTNWGHLVNHLRSQPHSDQIPPALLQQLETVNNYNPTLIATMKLFSESIKVNPALSHIETELICLREAYLEMTPLTHYSYGEDYLAFYFRIGAVPLQLDHCGPTPIKGEIQADIKMLIEDRIEQAEKHQKLLLEQLCEQKALEDKARSQEQDLLFSLSLFLDEAAEQQRCEQFKRTIVSASETRFTGNPSQTFNLSELLFPHSAPHTEGGSVDNKRSLQMHGALNNRITKTLSGLQHQMLDLETQLKQSKQYLALQKAEFCKILREAQCSFVASCPVDTSDWNTVNQTYQKQLTETYDIYIQNICDTWLFNRAPHLTAETLAAEKAVLKNTIDNIMKNDLKIFKSLKLSSANIQKAAAHLEQQKNTTNALLKNLKEQWALTLMPLDTLAAHCGILRRVRNQIQQQGMLAWPLTLQTLWDIEKHSLEATPNTLDRTSNTEDFSLLHYACWSGHIQLVNSLLEQGGKIEELSIEGYSALHFAVENITETAIPLLNLLLRRASSPEAFRHLKTTKEGLTPLHIAAEQGNLATVSWLLKTTPQSINDPDKYGSTALHKAARHNHAEVVRHLLSLDANGRALNQKKDSAIVLAVLDGHKKTVQVFFDNGICLNKAEIARCIKIIPKHPNPRAVIDTLAVGLTDMLQALSQLKFPTNPQGLEQALCAPTVPREAASGASYLPLYQCEASLQNLPNASVTVHATQQATQQPEVTETKDNSLS